MNSLDKQYFDLVQDILDNGIQKQDRTGTGTLSVFGRQIRHKMSSGFPILTSKQVHFKSVVTELLFFLRGETNIKYMLDNDCYIWVGDCYQRYQKTWKHDTYGVLDPLTKEEFTQKLKTDKSFCDNWGDLGAVYGKQWRKWYSVAWEDNERQRKDSIHNYYDQIATLINDLKTNPDSRRLMVSAWNVGELDKMLLPPCHYGFQVWTRELSVKERMDYWFKNNKPNRDVCDAVDESSEEEQHKHFDDANVPKRAISLMYNCRSQDLPLGTPFNICSYSLLLCILGKMVNMIPDELISNMGDCHIYLNQIDGIKEQLTRDTYDLPKLVHMKTDGFYRQMSNDLTLINHLDPSDFELKNYYHSGKLYLPLSN